MLTCSGCRVRSKILQRISPEDGLEKSKRESAHRAPSRAPYHTSVEINMVIKSLTLVLTGRGREPWCFP